MWGISLPKCNATSLSMSFRFTKKNQNKKNDFHFVTPTKSQQNCIKLANKEENI